MERAAPKLTTVALWASTPAYTRSHPSLGGEFVASHGLRRRSKTAAPKMVPALKAIKVFKTRSKSFSDTLKATNPPGTRCFMSSVESRVAREGEIISNNPV